LFKNDEASFNGLNNYVVRTLLVLGPSTEILTSAGLTYFLICDTTKSIGFLCKQNQ